jgi:hypothetical protein
MKYLLLFLVVLHVAIFAGDDLQKERELRTQKNIQKAIEFEEKYAKEQVFYDENNYDFNSSKVDDELLDSVPVIEPEYDFDMDDVYD